MCNNGITASELLRMYYPNNPRVTILGETGFGWPVYNATEEPGARNANWVSGTVVETGQMVYFPWGHTDQVNVWVDAQLAK